MAASLARGLRPVLEREVPPTQRGVVAGRDLEQMAELDAYSCAMHATSSRRLCRVHARVSCVCAPSLPEPFLMRREAIAAAKAGGGEDGGASGEAKGLDSAEAFFAKRRAAAEAGAHSGRVHERWRAHARMAASRAPS